MFTLMDRDADDCVSFAPPPAQGSADARRVGRAFAAATHGGFSSAIAELQAAVDAFVAPRREAGEAPERVIVALKNALALYGGLQALTEQAAETKAAGPSAVYDRVFRWTVSAYYDKR